MRADRRLLWLGDWHWLVRDPLDVLRIVFFGGTLAFAAMGRSTAVGLTAASLVLLLSRIINVPRRFDLGVIVAMTLMAWGTALSLYGRFGFYDTIVHGVAPLFYAPVLYVCLVRLDVLPDPEATVTARQHLGVLVSTLALGMAVSAGYEVIEWLSDSLAGTHFVESVDDTGRDLLAGTLGSLVGGVFLAVWSISSWTSRRVTYRAVPPPDVKRWLGRATAVRDRVEHAGTPALAGAGLAALAFGVLVAVWPEPAVRTLALLFGIYAIGYGALRLVAAARRRGRAVGISQVVDAGVTIAVGVALLAWPHISAAILFYLMAIAMVFAGLAGAAVASVLRISARDRLLLGIAAGVSVVLGIAVLAWPGEAIGVLRWLVAAQALAAGPVLIAIAIRTRERSPRAHRLQQQRESR